MAWVGEGGFKKGEKSPSQENRCRHKSIENGQVHGRL